MGVTIITPVRNGISTIAETFASIHGQSELPLEHIVLDANSTDGTSEFVIQVAQKLPFVRHIRERDKGLYDAMNKGIGLAKGEVVGIINADDLLEPSAIQSIEAAFSDPSIGYVYSESILIDEQGNEVGRGQPIENFISPPIYPFGFDWRFYTPFTHPTLFVRRSIYQEYGAFDLRYRLAADHDLMARLISKGVQGFKVKQPLARFRLGGLSSGDVSIFKENEDIAIRHGMPPMLAKVNRLKCTLGRFKNTLIGRTLK
jgi:glycosyltransferase involved in cell wall biosynthesis